MPLRIYSRRALDRVTKQKHRPNRQKSVQKLCFQPLWTIFGHFSADCKRGRRKGATSKKRQKSSKSVKKFFDTFRQFSRGTFFPAPLAIRWIFRKFFRTVCRHSLSLGCPTICPLQPHMLGQKRCRTKCLRFSFRHESCSENVPKLPRFFKIQTTTVYPKSPPF